MYSRKSALKTPSDFNFPFVPYQIQQEFMQSLYEVIENGQIGIFESPTGTGKSLTLTCGALKWLQDHNELTKSELNQRIEEVTQEAHKLQLKQEKSKDWIQEQFGSIQKKNEVLELKKSKNLIDEHEHRITKLKEKRAKNILKFSAKVRAQRKAEENASVECLQDDDLVIEDSDDSEPDQGELDDDGSCYKEVKILFCSRTHSQLAQVVREIKRAEYGKEIRCSSLASRQNLCIHPAVRSLTSSALINERCLDMQKSQSKATSSDNYGRTQKKARTKQITCCPYKSQSAVEDLRDFVLSDIADIEELISAGETIKACPYYSARMSSKDSQIIMLPYQMLLHRKTRIQSGIDLENSVIIIDEAHNLLDTISTIYSNEISLQQLQDAQEQLTAYKTKYCTRLSMKNLLKINQLIFITKRLVKMLATDATNANTDSPLTRTLLTHELMSIGEFFNIDLFKILEFCEETRLAQKVHGFAQRQDPKKALIEPEVGRPSITGLLKKLEKEQQEKMRKGKQNDNNVDEVKKTVNITRNSQSSVIRPLLGFLESLTECSDDGRVILKFDSDPKKACMKFMLLNPGGHFEELVKKCRAIIIAGGTMQPTTELTDQLFKFCPERIKEHFYSHVVPPESILSFAVQKGPTAKKFLFNFSNRKNTEMLSELGMTLQNLCQIIPAGIVCFFASYDFLDNVYQHLAKSGNLGIIETKKYVFREPRSGQSVEKVLADYAHAIADSDRQGAILFSVVGGKLSEGLNFTDDLARCVVVVGMPYPNKNSPELREKMKYLESSLHAGAGSEYYENLCMKAVNQCIGRSVRHINDYASVLLLDERYTSDRVKKKLPQWIAGNLKEPTYGKIHESIAKFFRNRRKSRS